jgi:hypothetical protein
VWAERGIVESETEVVWNAVAQLVEALRYKPKVEGSSLEFFTDNLSGRTVAVGWTQFVTAMSYHFVGLILHRHMPNVSKFGNLNTCNPLGLYKDCFTSLNLNQVVYIVTTGL